MSMVHLRLLRFVVCAWCLAGPALGCSVNRMAVDTTAGVLAEAESSTRSYFDWESAGQAAGSGIMQLEGLHAVSPENEELSLMLVKAYMAYAYGWVMDAHELARDEGDEARADHHRQRAYLMYSRARDLAMRVLTLRDERFFEMAREEPKVFRAYLEEEFDDLDEDVPPLFWLMMSWSSAINNGPTMDDFVDMPSVKVIAEWIADKNEAYEDAGALVFLGGLAASYPKAVGGDPDKGKQYFERAAKLTGRKSHVVLFNYALFYAVNAQERRLFLSLLREIIDAGDQGAAYRLANKVARRRALRLLARTDELFM